MEHLLPNGQNGNLTSNLFRAVVIVNKMEYFLPKDQNGYFTSNLVSRRIHSSEQNGNLTYKWSPKWNIYFQMTKMEILLQIRFAAYS